MNQQVMLRKLKKMQDEMLQTQKEIEETVFKASAGGVVTIEMFGTKDEILNLAVNNSLDKVYFTLIKALNSVE